MRGKAGKTQRLSKLKFRVSQHVRLSKEKMKFVKGGEQNYTTEIFKVRKVVQRTQTPTPSPAYTGRPYIFKTLIAPQTATFSIPTAAILLFPPSKISYDAIVQSGNTTERNSKDLPLQSVANIAASSLYNEQGLHPATICGPVCC